MSGKLYIIPTPIGNLEDITYRTVRILKEINVLYAEDTRVTGKLLQHLDISKPLRSYHQHNEHQIADRIVNEIEAGEIIGLVSDAGTPGISDPGFLLVRALVEKGLEIETLPGPTAFIPALVNSGLPCDRFTFEGFLPQKKGRQTRLEELKEAKYTFVLYESPYRVLKTLKQLIEVLGEERKAAFSRELTKIHEENKTGTLLELLNHLEQKDKIKGEFVLIVEGNK